MIRRSLASLASALDKQVARLSSSETRTTLGRNVRLARGSGEFQQSTFLQSFIVNAAIVINVVQMGASLEIKGGVWNTVWNVIEYVVLGIFIVEMVVNVSSQRISYLKNWMNWIDVTVVLSSLLELVLDKTHIQLGKSMSAVNLLKMLRLFRLLRMVKLLRVFPKLKLILDALIESGKAMLWLVMFLGIFTYVISILCVMLIGHRDAGYPGYNDKVADPLIDPDVLGFNNYKYFGTLMRSMVTLFHLSMLSDEMVSVIRGTVNIQQWAAPMFCAYILIATMCLMNTIVGVIVQRTMASFNEHQEALDVKMKEQMDAVKSLACIMFDLDEDGDGQLTKQELATGLQNDAFNELLQRVDIPWGFTVDDLFSMLDTSCRGKLSKSEFTTGLFHLIFSSEFQRECRSAVHQAGLKKIVIELKDHLLMHLDYVHEQLKTDLKVLAASHWCASAGVSKVMEVNHKSTSHEPVHVQVDALRSVASSVADTSATDADACPVLFSNPVRNHADSTKILESLDQAIEILNQARCDVDLRACPLSEKKMKPHKGSFTHRHVDKDVLDHTVPLEARLRPSSQLPLVQDTCFKAHVLGKPLVNEVQCSLLMQDPSDRVGLLAEAALSCNVSALTPR